MKKLLLFWLFLYFSSVFAYSGVVEIKSKGCIEGDVVGSDNDSYPICTIPLHSPSSGQILRIYITLDIPFSSGDEITSSMQGDYFFWVKYKNSQMDTPLCWCYKLNGLWSSCDCDAPLSVYQGNFIYIQDFEILSLPYNILLSLPEGSYEIHFAVDTCIDGTINLSDNTSEHLNCLTWDSALVIKIAKDTENSRLDINNWAYQLQGPDPNIIASSGFDMVVMDYSLDGTEEGEFSPQDIQIIKDAKILPIAYLSIGEAEDYRFYWQENWDTTPPDWLGEENPEWEGNFAVKYWSAEWERIIYRYLDKIIEQGFSGVYLDKIDEFEYWADYYGGDEHLYQEEYARKMIDLILDIANYAREKTGGNFYIIPQNGEKILAYDNGTLMHTISGWAVEDIFYNETQLWSEDESRWIMENRLPYLEMVISQGKPVLSVDYVDDGSGYQGENKLRIDDYVKRATSKGFIPYAAIYDRELDEINVINNVQP